MFRRAALVGAADDQFFPGREDESSLTRDEILLSGA